MFKQVLLFSFLLLLFAGCRPGKEMPELQDGNKLRQDCVRLLANPQLGDIPTNLWTQSIKELKPMRVIREEKKIRILLRQEQGKFTVGYDVFEDTGAAPSTKGVWAQKTKFKGVWIFKLPY